MIIKRNSWHYKLYSFFGQLDERDDSVCSYWGKVITFPFWGALSVVGLISITIIAFPVIGVVWAGNKVAEKCNLRIHKPTCPFGKVKFEGK